MRRHLNHAQRSEIGLLLLEEEERLAKERMVIGGELKDKASSKIPQAKKGKSSDIVGAKVRVSGAYISRAKKIKEIAEKEPQIAEEWEKAKREETNIRAVYEKAKAVEEAETILAKIKKLEEISEMVQPRSLVFYYRKIEDFSLEEFSFKKYR